MQQPESDGPLWDLEALGGAPDDWDASGDNHFPHTHSTRR
jgi:hypothetical protein